MKNLESNLRMRCHNYTDLFWGSATHKQFPNFFNSQFRTQSVAYLEIILPGIIILFQGNMGSRPHFPLIQILITPLSLQNSQSYFLTATFTLPSQAPNTSQTRKRRQVASLGVVTLWFSLCFQLYFSWPPLPKKNQC